MRATRRGAGPVASTTCTWPPATAKTVRPSVFTRSGSSTPASWRLVSEKSTPALGAVTAARSPSGAAGATADGGGTPARGRVTSRAWRRTWARNPAHEEKRASGGGDLRAVAAATGRSAAAAPPPTTAATVTMAASASSVGRARRTATS